MATGSYLPSAQFILIIASIALSSGLVIAAERYTAKKSAPAELASATESSAQNSTDWKTALEDIQQQSGITLPEPPSEESIAQLLAAAKSDTVTDTVSRTLLINLASAASQGLGQDIPTQEQLVAQALNQLPQQGGVVYTRNNLSITTDSPETLRAYGNAVMATLQNHPEANAAEVLRVIGSAADQGNGVSFEKIIPIQKAYQDLVGELLSTPVPQTISPLHLLMINGLEKFSGVLADLQAIPTDPLRGLLGLQNYQLVLDEEQRVFTTIAQQLQRNAILFTKDEPGSAWSEFLSPSPQAP